MENEHDRVEFFGWIVFSDQMNEHLRLTADTHTHARTLCVVSAQLEKQR